MLKIEVTCFSTAGGPTVEAVGDALVGEALGHQPEHFALARREVVERVHPAAAAEHPRDDLRVQRRSSLRDLAHGGDEVVEVGDAVLEQVADAARVLADELGRVALDEVLGEHEHADLGVVAADLERRAQAVVGEVGRHPHVDDRDVRLVRADLAQQVRRVARASDDLDPRVLEQPRDALAEQQLVVGDHGAHASDINDV